MSEAKPVCESCIEAVVASAKVAGEDYENAEFVRMLALRFGASISEHYCVLEEDEEGEDEGLDCWCGCSTGDSPFPVEFGEVTTKGRVCENCLEAVTEAAMLVGQDYDDLLVVYMLARTSGGDIFDHDCEAEDDEDVDCHCGCQRN